MSTLPPSSLAQHSVLPQGNVPEASVKPRILVELKTQTRPHHDSIEGNRFGKALMDGTMSLDDYKLFMQKFYGFHVPMEDQLSRFVEWESVGITFDQRRKVAALAADLRCLGLSDDDIDALPLCSQLPPLQTLWQALGAFYVMEGSTLGGQIQLRQVQKLFGLSAGHGAAYFASYGPMVGMMWKQFCEALVTVSNETTDPEHAAEQVIIASASATFNALEAWLKA
jgi:heme oxygenase